MKPIFLFLIIIAGITTTISLPIAHSDVSSNNKYLLQGSGYVSGAQTVFDSTIAFQITTGVQEGSNTLATLDNGLATIAGDSYLSNGIWQTLILRDGKYLIIVGDAQDQSGNKIHLDLFGRVIDNNPNGALYTITGKITGSETMRVIFSAKVTSVNSPTSSPVTNQTTSNQPPPGILKITILTDAHSIDNQQYFSPSITNLAPGSTIVWTNNDSVPHRIMSGIASAMIRNQSAPTFESDGKIDSGIIPPGQSFQFTLKSFDFSSFLNPAVAKYLGLSQSYTAGDITFFDPNYGWMVGVISPLSQQPTQGKTVQISIVQGASNSGNGRFLSPSSLQIIPGTVVMWINNDLVPHRILSGQLLSTTQGSGGAPGTLVAPHFIPDGNFDSGNIAPGQSFSLTITGTYTYQFYDPSYTWINGVVVSAAQAAQTTPIQITILPGSSLSQGSASQSNQMYYNRYYSQSDLTIAPGTPIIWTNNDSVYHTIYSGTSTQRPSNPFTPDGKIASGKILPGQSFEVIINDTGIIRFYDPQYTWMNGVLVSIPPSPSHTIAAPSHNPGLH